MHLKMRQGVNTGANTNATYANTDKKYGLSAVVNSLGYEHQLDDAANWTAHDAIVKPLYFWCSWWQWYEYGNH